MIGKSHLGSSCFASVLWLALFFAGFFYLALVDICLAKVLLIFKAPRHIQNLVIEDHKQTPRIMPLHALVLLLPAPLRSGICKSHLGSSCFAGVLWLALFFAGFFYLALVDISLAKVLLIFKAPRHIPNLVVEDDKQTRRIMPLHALALLLPAPLRSGICKSHLGSSCFASVLWFAIFFAGFFYFVLVDISLATVCCRPYPVLLNIFAEGIICLRWLFF